MVELLGASAGHGVAGGRGYGERRRRALLGLRERERAEEGEGVEREQRARGETEGATGHIQTRRGRLGGKQEVARAASALATELLRCEGRKTTGEKAAVGWAAEGAGPAGLPGEQQVGLLLFFIFFFCFVLFNFVLPLF